MTETSFVTVLKNCQIYAYGSKHSLCAGRPYKIQRRAFPDAAVYKKGLRERSLTSSRSIRKNFKKQYGVRVCYPSDEFFLKAERPMPSEEYYDDYPQIDNGVGLWTSLRDEFFYELSVCENGTDA